MATNKRQFTMRMQDNNFEKIKYISDNEKRSMAAQIEILIEEAIKKFELVHGVIEIPPKKKNN